jgi:hypothetical protein
MEDPMTKHLTTLLLVSGLLVAGAVGAPPAGAAKKKPFCDVVEDIGNFDNSGSNRSDAQRVANEFHSASKQVKAPKKVVKALNTIGDFYDAVADADNAAEQATVAARFGGRYAKAVTTYTKQFTKKCLVVTTTTSTTRPTGSSTSSTTSTTGSGSTSTTGSGSTSGTGSGSAGNATIAGSINGQAAVNPTGTCTGVGTPNGLVRSNDGTFNLVWSNGVYQLQWTAGGTTYLGPVQVIVVGTNLTFTGNAGGIVVQGAAACS